VIGIKLRHNLEAIFNDLASNAGKIALCTTTQENESFNNMMAICFESEALQ
jgi:hypothetical protein